MANIQNIEEYDNYSYNTWMISNAHFIKGILEDCYCNSDRGKERLSY